MARLIITDLPSLLAGGSDSWPAASPAAAAHLHRMRDHHVCVTDRLGGASIRTDVRLYDCAGAEFWHRLLGLGMVTGLAVQGTPFVP